MTWDQACGYYINGAIGLNDLKNVARDLFADCPVAYNDVMSDIKGMEARELFNEETTS